VISAHFSAISELYISSFKVSFKAAVVKATAVIDDSVMTIAEIRLTTLRNQIE